MDRASLASARDLPGDRSTSTDDVASPSRQARLELARRIAHETFISDHQALEVDTRPGFGSFTAP